ncbi:hypothetical protein ACIPF8_06330 [Collimonas sp. NPDC087041]|uniref:hypothetical protein n=1 Tax=Collimonas sp. NPDC087041 TaxID=3363960 RepID=UPI003810A62E
MNTNRQLIVAVTLFAALSAGIAPAMAAGPAKKAAAASEEIPMLPPIIIIGKRLTPEEKAMLAQQDHNRNVKKVARKKSDANRVAAFTAL